MGHQNKNQKKGDLIKEWTMDYKQHMHSLDKDVYFLPIKGWNEGFKKKMAILSFEIPTITSKIRKTNNPS